MIDQQGQSVVFRTHVIRQDVVFIDFDHTLFGTNTTELFIAWCRPRWLASLIDLIVRELFPWRLTGLRHAFRVRDYVCCVILLAVMPWNLCLWRLAAAKTWRKYGQAELNVFLDRVDRNEIVIVSFGMKLLIDALVRESEWRGAQVIATPLLAGRKHFGVGKLQMVRRSNRSDVLDTAAFITDSNDDADLLGAVALGIRIEPLGEVFRSLERLYFPFRYTMRAKYPFKYFIDQLLFVDMAVIVIATSGSWSSLVNDVLIVTPLFLAFMMIYEIGYFENDAVGASHEETPSLTANVARFRHYPIEVNAWIWALAFTFCGTTIYEYIHPTIKGAWVAVTLTWIAVLGMSRAVFFCYNRIQVASRLFTYPLLQLLKYGSIFLVLPPASIMGEALISGQIVLMSVVYLVYRAGGRKPNLDRELWRTLIIGAIVVVDAMGSHTIIASSGFTLLLAAAWLLLRNCKSLLSR